MALQKAALPIPFAGGVETQQDAKQVPGAKLLDLINGVFTKATTISKRNGYRALSTTVDDSGGAYTDPRRLASRDAELLLLAARRAYSYRPDADRWDDAGEIASLVARERPLVKTGTEQSQGDAATVAGVTVVAWTDSRGGVWGALVEEATGRVLLPAEQLGTGTSTQPRCVAVGAALHVYYAETDAGRIDVAVADSANPLLGFTVGALAPDLYESTADTPLFDACAAPALTAGLIVWRTINGYKIGYVTPDGQLGSALTGLPAVVEHLAEALTVAVATTSTLVTVAWGSADELNVDLYDPSDFTVATGNTTVTAPTTITGLTVTATVAADQPGGDAQIALELASATTEVDRDRRVVTFGFTGADLSTIEMQASVRGVCLASRAFADDGICYAYTAHDAPFFSVYLLLRLDTGSVVARTMPIIAHGRARDGWLASVTADPADARVSRVPLLYNEQLEALAGVFAETGLRWTSLAFDADGWQSAQLGRGLYVAGACPLHYDGDRWAEAGFHYAPDGDLDAAAGAVGAMADGVYTYRAVYEEIDAQGEVHRGPASIGVAVQVVAGGAGSVALALPTYRATGRRRVRIGVFRSEANDTASFHRVSSVDPSATGPNGYVLSNAAVDTVAFVDGMSDTDLLQQEELYTNGGAFSNDPPPFAGGAIAVGKSRLFWTDPADPLLVRYSQEIAPGYAAELAAPLALAVDPFGGAVVNVAVLDDAVIVLCERALHVFGGQGPTNVPSLDPSASFSPPQMLTSDCGLADPGSLAVSPVGLMFKSTKGIRLLGRDRQLAPIGTPVEAYDDEAVTRAILMPGESRIIFLTANPESRSLLFDYEHQQWSTFTNHAGLDGLSIGAQFYYLRADGRVFAETPGVYADDNSQIRMRLETAWIKFAGYLQGWQRIWHAQFLGQWISTHVLRVRFALDYEQDWSAPFDLDVDNNFDPSVYGDGIYGDGVYGGNGGSTVYQRRIHIGKRCQAIRFAIEDVEPTAARGASFELSEMLLTGGIVGPAYKLGATRQN